MNHFFHESYYDLNRCHVYMCKCWKSLQRESVIRSEQKSLHKSSNVDQYRIFSTKLDFLYLNPGPYNCFWQVSKIFNFICNDVRTCTKICVFFVKSVKISIRINENIYREIGGFISTNRLVPIKCCFWWLLLNKRAGFN